MNICIDITKEFDSVINYDFFFDSAPMYPVIFLNHFDDTMHHYELELMNFGLNISDRMERMFLENKKSFGNIIDCSFEFKSLLIYGKSQIAIDGVKGLDIRYSNKNEILYCQSAYQVEEGDFDFVCGGFSSFSEHFVLAHIIAGHDAKATITFSSEDYLLMSSDTPGFQKMASKRQTPFKIENKDIFNTITNKFSQTPGKMFDIDFYSKYFRPNFDGEFNTTIAIKSEIFTGGVSKRDEVLKIPKGLSESIERYEAEDQYGRRIN